MKYILTFIILTFLSRESPYPCYSYKIEVFPRENEICINSMIILDGISGSQEVITTLNYETGIYFKTKGHKVKLIVEEECKGMFDQTQALLRPEEQLLKGKTYILQIDNLNEAEEKDLTRINPVTKQYDPIKWIVNREADTINPILNKQPQLKEQVVIRSYAGLDVWSIFKFECTDQSEILVETEMHDLTTNENHRYYLPLAKNSELYIGHNACNGAFTYLENHEYKIRFRLMDISGNKQENWTKWLSLKNPLNKIKNE
jgi:hypothetical protein